MSRSMLDILASAEGMCYDITHILDIAAAYDADLGKTMARVLTWKQ